MDLFIGEIRIFPFLFAPHGWLECDGALYPTSDQKLNALFQIIGYAYGGGGSQFGVPDLRGRVPVQIADPVANGVKYDVGMVGGQAHVQLLPENMPQHTHILQALNSTASQHPPLNGLPAIPKPAKGVTATEINIYGSANLAKTNLTPLAPASILPAGGNQPHPNIQPSMPIKFYINYGCTFI